jgi:cytoskeletal protein CcmA (bactofilin family)
MINSIVGESTRLKGDFEIDGVLRIDGFFEGSIKGNTQVLIGERGKAALNLEVNEIVIGGQVEGKIKVRGKVKMLATGYLKGEVEAENIEIEPGAFFSGKCQMLEKS